MKEGQESGVSDEEIEVFGGADRQAAGCRPLDLLPAVPGKRTAGAGLVSYSSLLAPSSCSTDAAPPKA